MAFIEGQSANLKGEIQLGAKGFVTIGGDGLSGSIEVIDTITVDSSQPAIVENTGTPTEVKLRFLIPKGLDGYTPQKGVDYWTPTEVEEIVAKPAQAETDRASAETARANAESERASAESSRITAETARANAETSRATAEQGRINAESERVSAEQLRAAAETERAGFYEGFNSELNSLKDNLTEQNTRIAALEEGSGSSGSGSNVPVARVTRTTKGSIVNNSTKEEWGKFLETIEGYLEVTNEDTGTTLRCPFLGLGVADDTKGRLLVFSFGSFYYFKSNEKFDEYIAFDYDERREDGIVGYRIYDRTTQMQPATTN